MFQGFRLSEVSKDLEGLRFELRVVSDIVVKIVLKPSSSSFWRSSRPSSGKNHVQKVNLRGRRRSVVAGT